jgi:Slime mold cyclic AMP receptor
MGFSDYQQAGVILCELVCNSFGLLGSILIIILYLSYSQIRILEYKLVALLSISISGYSIGVLIGPSDSFSCKIQATIISYFALSSVLWLYLISYSVYTILAKQQNPESHIKKYLLIGYVLPIPTTVIPVFTGSYSRTSLGMCWINPVSSGTKALIFIQLWLVLLGILISNTYIVYKNYQSAKKIHIDSIENSLSLLKYYHRLKYFSFVIYVSWGFAFINIIAMVSNPNSPNFGLTILHVMFNGILGIFCLIAFIKDHAVYEVLIETFSVCLPCLLKKQKKNKRKLELQPRV